MTDKKGRVKESMDMQQHTVDGPAMAPPSPAGATTGYAETSGASRPADITVERILSAAVTQEPTLSPPGTAGATVAADGVTGTWSTVTIDATWSINETRNAFVHVAGGAWKKIFNGTDGAFMTLLTLATQAKQTGRQIVMREEADGLIHEIYLW
jgi:hypothetical protein